MQVSELHSGECYELLARLGFGRLACARKNQPYIVPIYFAYEPHILYGFATLVRRLTGCARTRWWPSRRMK